MLVWSEYFRDLGYKPKDFPFANHGDRDSLDKETGVVPCQTWSLEHTIALELYAYLRAFRDSTHGVPTYLEYEEWLEILNEMVECFGSYARNGESLPTEKRQDDLRHGLNLLRKYFFDLWW